MPIDSSRYSYQQKQERKRKFLIFVLSFLLFLVIINLFLAFIIKPFWINSDSMQPEFSGISAVFVAPYFHETNLFIKEESLQRGSVVTIDNNSVKDKTVFEKIADFFCGMFTLQRYRPFESERWGDSEVYRIIGLPGDTIYIDNYIAKIKPQGSSYFLTEFELSENDYDIISDSAPNNWDTHMGTQGFTDEITLKKDEYFVLSDNRIVAIDSRVFGPVAVENINGKAVLQYFPFNNFRVLP